jgi:hypothetical protein
MNYMSNPSTFRCHQTNTTPTVEVSIMTRFNRTNGLLFLVAIMCCLARCAREHTPLNITLHDKPLRVIESYISGSWKFQYAYGGIMPMRYSDRHNSYMVLQSNHIVMGNDSSGVVVDGPVLWTRGKDIFNDSTYLLGFYNTPSYAFPYYYVVDRIYNDTLILIDNASDAVYYHYIR